MLLRTPAPPQAGPELVGDAHKDAAGTLMAFCLVSGLTAGAIVSLVLEAVVEAIRE